MEAVRSRPQRQRRRADRAMNLSNVGLLLGAGLAAGTVNAVAGGGSLVPFPALLGVMLVAGLGLVLAESLRRVNARKNLISAVCGLTTVVVFALIGTVDWAAVAILAPATITGGYVGARLARRLPAPVLRALIVTF